MVNRYLKKAQWISYSKIVTIQYSDLSGEQVGNKINIYPNPAGNNISLNIVSADSKPAIYSIQLVNTAGVTIKETTSSEPFWQGSVGNL